MSSGEPRRQADTSTWTSAALDIFSGNYTTIILLALGVGLIVMILLTLGGLGGAAGPDHAPAARGDPLEDARQTLEHDADVNACHAALAQVNLALATHPDLPRPAPTDAALQEHLRKDFGLDDKEAQDVLSEVGADNYTQLDGNYLAGALLFRDAATHALEPEEVGANLPAPEPLERATAAFAWAVREVRLAAPSLYGVTPPQFVLRRSSGTPLERALVFLDMLDRLSAAGERGESKSDDASRPPVLIGCLVFCKGREAPSNPWACGVLIDGKPDVYLFDPLLGLPLPGEGGKGVATLAGVIKNPDLLKALKIEGAPAYDVTADQAKTAELQVVCSASSLAPRMRLLQDRLLPPLRVALAHDLDRELGLWRHAADRIDGAKPSVKPWQPGPVVLRDFLPPEEGGSDLGMRFELRTLVGYTDARDPSVVQMQHNLLFQLELAPWEVMPAQFQEHTLFPYNVGLGDRVRKAFFGPFAKIALEPGGPRDRMLRGDFDKAAADLVMISARMDQQKKNRAEAGADGSLEKDVNAWFEKARKAYADQLRAQDHGTAEDRASAEAEVADAWNTSAPVRTLLEGASAAPCLAEATYQLGLCKHERALQAQARLDLMRRRGGEISPLEAQDLRTAWMDALGWWKKYGDDHPEESPELPSTCPGRAAAVRQMRAEAQARLGQWKEAAATYEDMTKPMSDLEKLAGKYRAGQVRKEHAAETP